MGMGHSERVCITCRRAGFVQVVANMGSWRPGMGVEDVGGHGLATGASLGQATQRATRMPPSAVARVLWPGKAVSPIIHRSGYSSVGSSPP